MIEEDIKKLMLDSNHFDKDQFKNGHVRILSHKTYWDDNAVQIIGKLGFWTFPHILIEAGYFISNVWPEKDRMVWIVTSKKKPEGD